MHALGVTGSFFGRARDSLARSAIVLLEISFGHFLSAFDLLFHLWVERSGKIRSHQAFNHWIRVALTHLGRFNPGFSLGLLLGTSSCHPRRVKRLTERFLLDFEEKAKRKEGARSAVLPYLASQRRSPYQPSAKSFQPTLTFTLPMAFSIAPPTLEGLTSPCMPDWPVIPVPVIPVPEVIPVVFPVDE